MRYLLQIVGILMLLTFGARMFGFLDRLIKTDAVWLCFLFGGILVCMGGFWLEEYQSKPMNDYQARQRVSKMANCRNAVCLCMVVLLILVSTYI